MLQKVNKIIDQKGFENLELLFFVNFSLGNFGLAKTELLLCLNLVRWWL